MLLIHEVSTDWILKILLPVEPDGIADVIGVVNSSVFINFDDDAPPLRDSLEPFATYNEARGANLMRTRWWHSTNLPVNWKLAQEAFMEAYHVVATHPQLLPALRAHQHVGWVMVRSAADGPVALGATGRNWLFFGDQKRASDFLYEEEWLGYLQRKQLARLDQIEARGAEASRRLEAVVNDVDSAVTETESVINQITNGAPT